MSKSVFSDRYKIMCAMLVQARRSAGLSQTTLAAKLNKLQAYVSKYERGERRLDLVEFLDIAKVLDINPADFIDTLEKRAAAKLKRGRKPRSSIVNHS